MSQHSDDQSQRQNQATSNSSWSHRNRFNLGFALIGMLALFAIQYVYVESQRVAEITYSQFETYLENGRIDRIQVSNQRIKGTFSEPVDGKGLFLAQRVEPEIADKLDKYDVEYDGTIENPFFQRVLSWLIPIALLLALWLFLSRRMMQQAGGAGGLMQIGRSNARVYYEERTNTGFDHVAGIDEVRDELQEVVAYLRNPADYGRLGAKIPKGVLLAGPPGTGKTLLARAMAGEAEVPFFYINGSEFVEMFVGVGAARTRDLFRQAREKAPAIIFIDELDALGQQRGGSAVAGGGHDEKEQTLNQLLVEMDGFDPSEGLIIIGATNRPEVLDQALLRAGRFDRRVIIDRPDRKGRREILAVHADTITMDEDVDLSRIAELTPGFTGADLESLVNEAALMATRRNASAVHMEDFTAGLERVVAGLQKKNQILSEEERHRVAYHELGHALLTLVLPGTDPVQKVSIIPRSVGALGYTLQRPTGDRYLMTRQELVNKMSVLLGGRAAEALFFDDVSTGAQDDLQKVTDIARAMVTQYGMTDALGQLSYERGGRGAVGMRSPWDQAAQYSEQTSREIDNAARALVEDAYERTKHTLAQYRQALHLAAEQLLDQETMDEDALRRIFNIDAPGSGPAVSAGGSPREPERAEG